MRRLIQAAIMTAALAGVGTTTGAAPQATSTVCDTLTTRIGARHEVAGGAPNIFALLTTGASPLIQLAQPDAKNVSLGRDPAADMRVQFEKRFRAEFGEAPALVRELRNWDALDVMTLPDSDVHMLITTTSQASCETRIFFRTTPVREAERLPDPPATGADDPSRAICASLGGRGYLARVNGVEAFLEYRAIDGQESFRIVPLIDGRWAAPCAFAGRRAPVAERH